MPSWCLQSTAAYGGFIRQPQHVVNTVDAVGKALLQTWALGKDSCPLLHTCVTYFFSFSLVGCGRGVGRGRCHRCPRWGKHHFIGLISILSHVLNIHRLFLLISVYCFSPHYKDTYHLKTDKVDYTCPSSFLAFTTIRFLRGLFKAFCHLFFLLALASSLSLVSFPLLKSQGLPGWLSSVDTNELCHTCPFWCIWLSSSECFPLLFLWFCTCSVLFVSFWFFCFHLREILSLSHSLHLGICQGSVLSPLFFLFIHYYGFNCHLDVNVFKRCILIFIPKACWTSPPECSIGLSHWDLLILRSLTCSSLCIPDLIW